MYSSQDSDIEVFYGFRRKLVAKLRLSYETVLPIYWQIAHQPGPACGDPAISGHCFYYPRPDLPAAVGIGGGSDGDHIHRSALAGVGIPKGRGFDNDRSVVP